MVNIVLIGMPGAGKSTIGKFLASFYDLSFVDGDDLIERSVGMPIQSVVDELGLDEFLRIEEKVLLELDLDKQVLATGGSSVYSESAMHHLARAGVMVYLSIELSTLLARVNNVDSRGLVLAPDRSLEQLYHERKSLYHRHAEITFPNDGPFSSKIGKALATHIDNYSHG